MFLPGCACRAVRDAQQYAADDAQLRALARQKDRLERLLAQAATVQRTLDRRQRRPLQEAERSARKLLKNGTLEQVTQAADDLEARLSSQPTPEA